MNSKIENPGALSSYGPISSFKAMDEPKSPCSLAKASVAFGGAVTLVGVVLLATGVGAPLGAGLIVLGVGSVLLTEACYLLGGGLLWLQGREEELSAYWRNDPVISCYEEMKNMFSSSSSYCLADVDHSDLSEEEFTGFGTTLTKLQGDVENVDMGSRYISHLIDPNHPLAKIWEFAKYSAINEEGLERLVQECGLKGKLGRSVVGNVVDVFTRSGHTALKGFLSSESDRESLSEAISWTGRVRVSKDLTES